MVVSSNFPQGTPMIYGDYGDWGVIGHLRDLWLRDLRTVLMASGESERLGKLFELLDETKGKR